MDRLTQRIGQVFVGVMFVALSGTTAQAAWEGSSGSAAQEGILSGKITSVDPQQKLLKIKTSLFQRRDFLINDASRISDGSKNIALKELKPGDQVTISYSQVEGNKQVAQAIMVDKSATVKSAPENPSADKTQ